MERVCIITADKYLYQKIFLELSEEKELLVVDERQGGIDVCFYDCDSALDLPLAKRVIRMSRKEECDLPLPFLIGEAISLARTAPVGAALSLSEDGRAAFLHGERIKLTETEFSILSALVCRGGEFCSREELLRSAFKKGVAGGAINVYIHYLREKLECHGEKVIISSRQYGYKIDEKYLKGADV
ncbi:MAG: winged helix-turn-helix transcriptional regulator [Clostridia bacterium]|nr:winged helix-turn-helix transcriptional regulator [Clostridia bacterium]